MKTAKIDRLTKGLFNKPVKEEDVLREPLPGKLVLNGRVLSIAEKNDLINQAQYLKASGLNNILLDEMKHLCQKKLYFDSQTPLDLAVARMGLWFVDVYEKKLEKLSTMKQEIVPKKE